MARGTMYINASWIIDSSQQTAANLKIVKAFAAANGLNVPPQNRLRPELSRSTIWMSYPYKNEADRHQVYMDITKKGAPPGPIRWFDKSSTPSRKYIAKAA